MIRQYLINSLEICFICNFKHSRMWIRSFTIFWIRKYSILFVLYLYGIHYIVIYIFSDFCNSIQRERLANFLIYYLYLLVLSFVGNLWSIYLDVNILIPAPRNTGKICQCRIQKKLGTSVSAGDLGGRCESP